MATNPEQVVSQALESSEKLIWSGQPDVETMAKTMGRRHQRWNWRVPLAAAILIGGALYIAPQALRMFQDRFGAAWVLVVLSPLALALIINYLRSGRSRRYARSLAYGITDKRLLILEDGKVTLAFRPSQVKWAERRDRAGAPGLSDLIWEEHRLSSTGRSGGTNDPVQLEAARIGFKAQPNGEELLQRIESWRQGHLDATAREARDFVESRQENQGKPRPTGGRRIKSPALGFSIEAPEAWQVEVRRKKLIFGKTGVDWTENKWSSPDDSPDWNVVRLKNDVDSLVELQVHETPPINTLEQMANPKLPKAILKSMQLADQEPEFAVNGLRGFYLTRLLQGKGESGMALGETSDLAQWYQRQHVLHDGQRQYYVLSMWPKESPEQGEICEAIVSTLQAS